ncbi:MAG: hypothetical protein AB8I08_19450 [Sandaracinaceae bacterium]
MSLSAIAVLHVPPAVAVQALGSDGPRVDALEDAVCLHLGLELTAEPEALVAKLEELAGELLTLHTDPRGVPIYPAKYTLEGRTWEAVASELGEAADWVLKPAPAANPMAAMLGGMDPSALSGMLGGVDPSALAGMLGGQGGAPGADPAAMLQQMMGGEGPGGGAQDPAAMLQQMMGGGGDMGGLMEAAMQMMRQLADAGALEDLAKNMGAVAPDLMGQMPGNMDMGALAAQAQAALAADPSLEAKLRGALEGASQPEDADDAEE